MRLGQVLLNFASIIPAGMIVFFPSYKFLNTAKAQWEKSKTLEKFTTKKEVLEIHKVSIITPLIHRL